MVGILWSRGATKGSLTGAPRLMSLIARTAFTNAFQSLLCCRYNCHRVDDGIVNKGCGNSVFVGFVMKMFLRAERVHTMHLAWSAALEYMQAQHEEDRFGMLTWWWETLLRGDGVQIFGNGNSCSEVRYMYGLDLHGRV